MKRKDLIDLLNQMGFEYSHTTGSHMLFKHPLGARPVGVCHNAKNKDFGTAGVKGILKEAKLSLELGKQFKEARQ